MRVTILILSIFFYACLQKDNKLVKTPSTKGVKNEDKLFLGTGTDFNESTYEYKPSLNKYCCFYDDTTKLLIISFGWGDGFSGESIKIVVGDQKSKLFMNSGGCGLFDSFNYTTKHQALILSNPNLKELDTIKGYVEYIGMQDVAGMKERFKKYEADLKNNYGISMHYFDTLTPRTSTMVGNFILPKCIHTDSSELEYHDWMIQEAKKLINGY